ncbi:hypothetical protein QJQ45_013291 [Haematococcus lacustris]|nr:hypothetical protein QJQ45_005453 [Haematococcus lacustris]KAJ9519660.1 hypothetical protein QJQ45_013291 [Haematococcus lacustris]
MAATTLSQLLNSAQLACLASCAIGAIIALLALRGLLDYLRIQRGLSSVPRAPGYNWLLGHVVPLLTCAYKGKGAWDVMEEWIKMRGPIVRYRILNTQGVAVCDPAALKRVFQTGQKVYNKDLGLSYKPFLPILGSGLVTADGELWQKQRLLIGPALRTDILDDIIPIARNATERLCKKLAGQRGTGQPVDVEEEFRLLTLQVIGEAVLSMEPEECDRVFPQLYLPVMEEANRRVLRPYRMYLPMLPEFWRFRWRMAELNNFLINYFRSGSEAADLVGDRGAGAPQSFKGQGPTSVEGAGTEAPDPFSAAGLVAAGAGQQEQQEQQEQGSRMRHRIEAFDEMAPAPGIQIGKPMLLPSQACPAPQGQRWTARRKGVVRARPDILDRVMESLEASGSVWSSGLETQLCYEIKTFLLAGHETSAAMLTWSVYEMSQNPAVMEQVRAEGAAVFGKLAAGQQPPRREVDSMTYTLAVLKEALRKYSVVPVVTRTLAADDELHGHKLPRGTMVACILQGPRNCLGQHMALLEARVVLGMLAAAFTFTAARPDQGCRHPTVIPIGPIKGMHMLLS